MDLSTKLEKLKESLRSRESIVIAFSGGVDSALLLKVAFDVLGDKILAVTAKASTFPEREFLEAVKFAKDRQIPMQTIFFDELNIEGFSKNPVNRCYLCKLQLLKNMKEIAKQKGYHFVAEGSNLDDLGDFRPGTQAISELGVVSPLRDAGLTKHEIRVLSREMGLDTWDKPSFACLASRIPYGEEITKEKLAMIEKAEQYLFDLGLEQVRVRHHGNIARIEVCEEDFERLMDPEVRKKINIRFNEIGYYYSSLDLKGYRTGSMNEGFYERSVDKDAKGS
jgi:uncharacterized protein